MYIKKRGFTFIEILIVIGIIGMMALMFYPDVGRSLEVRKLENEARDILTTMQRAKFQAVKTKLNHRVRFLNENDEWHFQIEREDNPDLWNIMPGFIRKTISSKFNVNVNLPSQIVMFSSLGFISNFDTQKNSVTLQSSKIENSGQPDLRVISVYAGGSIQYHKSESD